MRGLLVLVALLALPLVTFAEDKAEKQTREQVDLFFKALQAKDADALLKTMDVPFCFGHKEVIKDREALKKGWTKLLNEKKVTLGKYQGLEFLIESAQLGFYRSRVYIVDGRMYQVSLTAPKEFVTSPAAFPP